MTELSIKQLSAEEVYPIRHKILRPHQTFEECQYDTDLLPSTFHVGGFIEHTLVSVASFSVDVCPELPSEKQYRLRAMATLPEFRRQNIGKSVILSA
ncbi:hypothetical protein ACFP65_07825 [Marinilactibacillus sp. GCM10026970]|uniref:hypothetical protein n=1 Tax=Marinilactibacillus sp. GCM10026970 TaxID=3252642 RepID=UPI00360FCEEB